MKIAAFELHLRPQEKLSLPTFKGSTFRGTFGRALKKTICTIKTSNCRECILYSNCPYPYIFETADENGNPLLRPFVFQIPEYQNEYTSDQIFKINIVLFGKAIDYVSYFIFSFQQMGEKGIGKYRSKFIVEKVLNLSPFGERKDIFLKDSNILKKNFYTFSLHDFKEKPLHSVKLEFLTPVQLRKGNKPTNEITFELFYTSLVRRYKRLLWAHSQNNEDIPQFSIEDLKKIHASQSQFKFNKFRRYSHRQKQAMYLMGLTGTIQFEGNLQAYYPMLKVGEFIHVGKNAAFGLGQYKILEES